jgi:putative transposase
VNIIRQESDLTIRRLSRAFIEPASTIGRWISPEGSVIVKKRECPVSGDQELRTKIRYLCTQDRHLTFGHRRIWALLKRKCNIHVNIKTVLRIMKEEGLCKSKIWKRPYRPHYMPKMKPSSVNQCWQIDMTSFQLSSMTTLFLIVVIDCYSRQIVGWNLSRRCSAVEWISALRMALENTNLWDSKAHGLILRSDNGSQPCSRKFTEFITKCGIKGQYTGYDAPDQNAFVERVIRTIKEEAVWPFIYDIYIDAHQAMDDYITYYNNERPHSALGYMSPIEFAYEKITLLAA